MDIYLIDMVFRGIDENILNNMSLWNQLIQDEPIPITDVRNLYKMMPKRGEKAMVKWGSSKQFDFLDDDLFFTYDQLVKDHGCTMTWMFIMF